MREAYWRTAARSSPHRANLIHGIGGPIGPFANEELLKRLDEVVAYCVGSRCGTGWQIEPLEDIRDVAMDRMLAQDQCFRDLPITKPSCHQAQDLVLTTG